MEFEEVQKLKLWWLYILLGIETIITGSIIVFDKNGMTWNEMKQIYFSPIFGVLIPYILVYFITKNSLTVKINAEGISYHYWPFSKKKTILWTTIANVYTRKYDALGEYGGWGLRYRLWFKFNDKAFIFNDHSTGLQIELFNGKKILFSTAKLDELSLFLINIKSKYNLAVIKTDGRER